MLCISFSLIVLSKESHSTTVPKHYQEKNQDMATVCKGTGELCKRCCKITAKCIKKKKNLVTLNLKENTGLDHQVLSFIIRDNTDLYRLYIDYIDLS